MPIAKPYDGTGRKALCQMLASNLDLLRGLMVRHLHCTSEEEAEELEKNMCEKLAQIIGTRDLLKRQESRLVEETEIDVSQLPEQLRTKRAIKLWNRLFCKELVDEHLRPICTGKEAGVIAHEMHQILEGASKKMNWKLFADLWQMNPETLRSYWNKAEMDGNLIGFGDRVRHILKTKEG